MFLLTYNVKPNTTNVEYIETCGAFVNCFIEADSFDEANLIARGGIEMNDWRIIELEEFKTITYDDFLDDSDKREYYEQALIDKEVFVFHTYPNEES
ncbi:MAG: hypothetical protein H6589_02600 [Flavobacteriales bacterium]|nr:hypothetical protein [Flavobacteriales bacterium]